MVIKYFTSQEQQQARVMGIGNLPTRTAIFDDAEVRANYPYIDGLKQSLVQLKPRPVTPFYGQMSSNVLQPNIGAVMTRRRARSRRSRTSPRGCARFREARAAGKRRSR